MPKLGSDTIIASYKYRDIIEIPVYRPSLTYIHTYVCTYIHTLHTSWCQWALISMIFHIILHYQYHYQHQTCCVAIVLSSLHCICWRERCIKIIINSSLRQNIQTNLHTCTHTCTHAYAHTHRYRQTNRQTQSSK